MTTVAPPTPVTIYVDTSFFVSLYLPDRHTSEVERRLSSRPSLWITPLHLAECTHAVEQHVFRKTITRNQADRALQRFHEHRAQHLCKEAALPTRALPARPPWPNRH